jgi:hypothetical protein
MDGYEEARWSRFCGWLLSYIEDYYSPFLKLIMKLNSMTM